MNEYTLKNLINTYLLPCLLESIDKKEQLVLLGSLKTDCLQAKLYKIDDLKRLWCEYVRRMSITSKIRNENLNIVSLNNQNLIIPNKIPALFELISNYSNLTSENIDHINDVISLASLLSEPQILYVAKNVNVFQLIINDDDKHSKMIQQWTHFEEGSICVAKRVATVSYFDKSLTKSRNKFNEFIRYCCLKLFKNVNKEELKYEVAIELNLITDISQLTSYLNNRSLNERRNTFHISNIDLEIQKKIKNESLQLNHVSWELNKNKVNVENEQSYFLPIYNQDPIDFIKISSSIYTFQSNSLHTFTGLSNNIKNNNIKLPVYVKAIPVKLNNRPINDYGDIIYEINSFNESEELIVCLTRETQKVKLFSNDFSDKFRLIDFNLMNVDMDMNQVEVKEYEIFMNEIDKFSCDKSRKKKYNTEPFNAKKTHAVRETQSDDNTF